MKYKEILNECVLKIIKFSNMEHDDRKPLYNIGYGVDNNYVRGMGVSILSIYENNKKCNLRVHAVISDIDDVQLNKLTELAIILKIDIWVYIVDDKMFNKFPVTEYFPKSMYYRLILPDLNANGFCLYLDADVMCMGKLEIFDINLMNYAAAVVRDYHVVAKNRESKLKLPKNTYFNSGVLYFNYNVWHEQNLIEKILKVLFDTQNKLAYPDQDALNIVLNKQVKYLDPKYNRINLSREADYESKLKDTRLMHFTAHPKPWTILWNYCGDEVLKGIYEKYEAMSPWQNDPLMLPVHYKHKKWYAQGLWKERRYKESLYWYWLYLKTKFDR